MSDALTLLRRHLPELERLTSRVPDLVARVMLEAELALLRRGLEEIERKAETA